VCFLVHKTYLANCWSFAPACEEESHKILKKSNLIFLTNYKEQNSLEEWFFNLAQGKIFVKSGNKKAEV
jgi:hypothetical protein